ncbi:MAG: aldehyde:ferredoxin oxidoreductase [Zestosphaera tikiterensis]|uniref:Aldehyde:ferredoxin oxidoreductase n=1 Tax=Zestosphaera tikiterensis TaxID=1973259 RepID=A0A2R7Y1Z1_9CREN|nr:MAG: aldehyde:ferredoxin oxidoreductase [Zestosphaera tikiterensis]
MVDPIKDELIYRVLYIDLSRKTFWVRSRPDLFNKFLGGTGVATQLLKEELRPDVDPLSPDNVVVLAIGLLTGLYPTASKVVAMFKSPLTGNLGESHAGGRAAIAIRMAGYGAIVIKGASEIPVYLSIHEGKVEFKDASALWGVRSSLTIGKVLREREPWPGLRTIMRIGRAGERLVRYASVVLETYRHFGRLGLGAVWGSKKLKAVVIGGKRSVPVADVSEYRKVYKEIFDEITKSPVMQKYHDLGTPHNVMPLNVMGALPTRNLTSGKFEDAEKLSGESFAEYSLARRVACAHCPVACIHIAVIRERYPHEKYFYTTRYIGYDYEPIYALGTMLGVSDRDGLLRLIEEVDVAGLDAMSTGVALAWTTEAFKRGLITEKETLVKPEWGDWKTYIEMVRYIVKQPNEFYATLALGTEEAARKYGGLEFALTYGKNEMPGYHTGPGAHLGYLVGLRHSHLDNAGYSIDQKYIGKQYPPPEKLVDEIIEEEAWRQVLTSLVLCLFARGAYKPATVVKALTPLGLKLSEEDLRRVGFEIYKEKLKLKLALGYKLDELKLPKRIFEIPTPNGLITEEYMIKALEYYRNKVSEMLK